MLACKPVNVSFEQAAVVPVSAITALQGLRDVGRVEQGRGNVTGASTDSCEPWPCHCSSVSG